MGINQFSDKFSRILAYSKDEGKRLSCSSIGPEHLLLGMLREEDSAMLVVLNRKRIGMSEFKHGLETEILLNKNYHSGSSSDEIQINSEANNILKLAVLEELQVADVHHRLP